MWRRKKTFFTLYVKDILFRFPPSLVSTALLYFNNTVFKYFSQVTVGGKQYTADHVLVAVGGRPTIPNIPGRESIVIKEYIRGVEFLLIPQCIYV